MHSITYDVRCARCTMCGVHDHTSMPQLYVSGLKAQVQVAVTVVRPRAYWGFYDIPRSYCPHCNYSAWFQAVVNASTAVYPSCYFQLPTAQDKIPATELRWIRNQTFVDFNSTITGNIYIQSIMRTYAWIRLRMSVCVSVCQRQ